MAWIKRNLFFVIGGVITLALLGAAGYYIWTGYGANSDEFSKLNETVGNLKTLIDQNPSPGNEQVNNTQTAKDQNKQLQAWISSASAYFQPIEPIPSGPITSESYANALHRTIDQLQKQADASRIMLPQSAGVQNAGFSFSFTAQRNEMKFAGGLDQLAVQLGEVRAISQVLFDQRINALDSIRRVRVSDDDNGPNASASDYIEKSPITNEMAVITPYVVSFRCFTPELSGVISGFATSSNAYIIKTINVQMSGNAETGAPGMAGMPMGVPPGPAGMPGGPGMAGMPGAGFPPPAQPMAVPPAGGKGGLQTVLKEQLLRVTMELDLVKLLPKN